MTTRPYELLARFASDGAVAGVSVRSITTINGRDFEGDPLPLSGASDPAFTQFAQAFSAAVVAQRDTLKTQVDTLTAEKQSLQTQLDAANARIAELTAQPSEPPQPIATLSQIRVWLLKTLGVTAIEQVNSMIASIPDELQRAIAYQQWEYANQVLRDNPFVLMIAQRLGLSEEQMDAAYLEATRIV